MLIVVLIVGILTAVAVPMYQRAVYKIRFSKLMLPAKTLASANEAYFLANGEYATTVAALDEIKGPVACFCALGHPETFERTLKDLGLVLRQKWRFPDHQYYTEENLRTFEATRTGLPLITTFKDFVKFPDNWRDILTKEVYVLSVNLHIRGGESEFKKFTNVLYPTKN